MNLEKEASEYNSDLWINDKPANSYRDFIAGADSNYVTHVLLQVQLDILLQARSSPITWIEAKIEELEQQIKELENGPLNNFTRTTNQLY